MFLTSLTCKGFKSFADKTVIDVEPGVNVIVGPNGSGKSNIVDALSWVLGTNSPKKIRGGSMTDVIFAGSPQRAPLGMARVEITIDNSAGLLGTAALGSAGSAQQFSEIRIAREVTSTGDSRYLINGQSVRALDVQELLGDAGLGRELHTIVGQGQLDEILNAKPEDRRSYIEEAAGILKHRRRRERAVKKLALVDVHTEKLVAIIRELRRQLKPLERQAEAANKAATLQADLRELRIRIAAHDLAVLDEAAARARISDADVAERERDTAEAMELERRRVERLTAQLKDDEPAAAAASATYHALTSQLERVRGTADLIDARRKHLLEYEEEPLAGRPPAELRAQADALEAESVTRAEERDVAREHLTAMSGQRRESEMARRAFEQRRQAEARRRAEAREAVLRWEGEVSAHRGSIASTEAELGRIASQLQSIEERATEAVHDVEVAQDEIRTLDAAEADLTTALEAAETDVQTAELHLERIVEQRRDLDGRRSSMSARAEALEATLTRAGAGAEALLAAELDGMLGRVADGVRADEDHRTMIAAVLATLDDAVVVESLAAGELALAWLAEDDRTRATVLVDPDAASDDLDAPTVDALTVAGCAPVATLFAPRHDGPEAARTLRAIRASLADTWTAPDRATAVAMHARFGPLTFVTPTGEVVGRRGLEGGRLEQESSVTTAAAADDARRAAEAAEAELAGLAGRLEEARDDLAAARAALNAANARINESDARIGAAAERLARVNKEQQSLERQRELVTGQRDELRALLERDRAELDALLGRGPEEVPETDDDESWLEEAQDLDEAVEAARERELDARVAVERLEERLRNLATRVTALRTEADEVERALAAAAERREQRRLGVVRCGELAAVCQLVLRGLEDSIREADEARRTLQQQVGTRREALEAARATLDTLSGDHDAARELRHEADLRRAEIARDIDALSTRLREEFSLAPDEAMAQHPDAIQWDRDALASEEDVLVRRLGLLGRVNPLALEEFQALEQRHAFLADQLAELRSSKRNLEDVVRTVDERIKTVFREAFNDIAAEFDVVFQTVFPGGEGRLVLTDPDDMLTTGIEVEARPPGKKVTRLSLLSGGERSLTVLAFVFAIFRARPSPFYVLDEVDAALDDVNLQRLLRVVTSFKDRAQLIVVTHQKRSMEIADVLYGVTMGTDAVTRVVAEKFSDDHQIVLDDHDRAPVA